MNVKQEKL